MSGQKLAQNLSRFRLVTFDVTDTLLKFAHPHAVQYAKTASSFGYKTDQRKLDLCFRKEFKKMSSEHPNYGISTEGMDWTDWWRKLVSNIFNQAEANIPPEDLNRIANKLIEIYDTEVCWSKVDAADEIINKIKSLDKRVGIISNFDPRLYNILKIMKLPQFDFILGSYKEKVAKPDIRIFELALRESGANKDEALHIGNTLLADYFGALNAGWSGIHISNSSQDWTSNSEVNKEHVFSTLRDLLDAMENRVIEWS